MLRIGLIGAGHLGKIHLKLWKEIKEVELVGFYDTNLEMRSQLEAEFGVKAFETEEEIWAQVDAVDVVTPTQSHSYFIQKALEHRKHVFVEKPFTYSLAEGAEIALMISEMKGTPLVLQVGHVERFNPAYQSAKPFIDNPMFIEAHRLAEFKPRGLDVSVVLDLMIHDLDIILAVVRQPIISISASGVSVLSPKDDIANARIEFANGCVANLTASRISLKNERKLRIFQSNAYLSLDFQMRKSTITIMDPYQDWMKEEDGYHIMDPGVGHEGKKAIRFIESQEGGVNAISEELRQFAQCIANNTAPEVGLEAGLESIKVAEEIIHLIDARKTKVYA